MAAVGDLLSLQARARTDRALDGQTTLILKAIAVARGRQVEADLASARKSAGEGRPFEALTIGERALLVADKLEGPAGRAAIARAETILGPIVARFGAVIVQRPGLYSLGSADAYDKAVGPTLDDTIRRQGYAPRPTQGPSRFVWDRHAPYRLEYQVTETRGGFYLASKNHTSEITMSLTLTKADRTLWQTRVLGRTQIPLPNLAAYVGSRMAVSAHQSSESERLLYENARSVTLEQVGPRVRSLPGPEIGSH